MEIKFNISHGTKKLESVGKNLFSDVNEMKRYNTNRFTPKTNFSITYNENDYIHIGLRRRYNLYEKE